MDKDNIRLSLLLKIVNNMFERELNNKISHIDLTSSQCNILGYLEKNTDREINQIDIEKEFNLKRPTVTGTLKRLEEKGFIKIITCKNDKRYKAISLTEKSIETHEIIRQNVRDMEKILYKNLSDEDKDEIYRILSIMHTNLLENKDD